MKNTDTIKKITGSAILLAFIVIFQFIGNNINIGGASINLSLLPIAIGAMLYGPLVGAFLGLASGAIIIPNATAFLAYNPVGTVIICLVKTTVAGLVCGLLFKLFKKKALIPGIYICSLLVPVINTGIFLVGCFTIFNGLMETWAGSQDQVIGFIFLTLIGINFLVEIIVAIFLTPSVALIMRNVMRKNHAENHLCDDIN